MDEQFLLGDKMRFVVRDGRPIPVRENTPESKGLAECADVIRVDRERLVQLWIYVHQSIGPKVTKAEQIQALLYGWVTDTLKLAIRHTKYAEIDNDTDLAHFLLQCEKNKLDPWGSDVYPIVRWDNKRQETGVFLGVRANKAARVAMATREYIGLSKPKHVRTKDGDPVSSTVTVLRKVDGERCKFSVKVRYDEYCPPDLVDPTDLWLSKPFVCLDNIARQAALRQAFPDECGQMYVKEEFARSPRRSAADQRKGSDDHEPSKASEPETQAHPLDDGSQDDNRGPTNMIQVHQMLNQVGFVTDKVRNKFIATMRAGMFGLEQANPLLFYRKLIEHAEREVARWNDGDGNSVNVHPPLN